MSLVDGVHLRALAHNKVSSSSLRGAGGSSARLAKLIDPHEAGSGVSHWFEAFLLLKAAVVLSFRISWAVLQSQPSVLTTVRQRLAFEWKWKRHSKLLHFSFPAHLLVYKELGSIATSPR